jgi:hypothetical protein
MEPPHRPSDAPDTPDKTHASCTTARRLAKGRTAGTRGAGSPLPKCHSANSLLDARSRAAACMGGTRRLLALASRASGYAVPASRARSASVQRRSRALADGNGRGHGIRARMVAGGIRVASTRAPVERVAVCRQQLVVHGHRGGVRWCGEHASGHPAMADGRPVRTFAGSHRSCLADGAGALRIIGSGARHNLCSWVASRRDRGESHELRC